MVKLNGRLGLVENSVGIVTLTMRCGGKTERLFGFDYFTFPVIFFTVFTPVSNLANLTEVICVLV